MKILFWRCSPLQPKRIWLSPMWWETCWCLHLPEMTHRKTTTIFSIKWNKTTHQLMSVWFGMSAVSPSTWFLWLRWSQPSRCPPGPPNWFYWPAAKKPTVTQSNNINKRQLFVRLCSSGRHLLRRVVRVGVVPLLREDDVEDGVRTTAGLVHVGGGDGPAKWWIRRQKSGKRSWEEAVR